MNSIGHYITTHSSGVIEVIFNTESRWNPYSVFMGVDTMNPYHPDAKFTCYVDVFREDNHTILEQHKIDIPVGYNGSKYSYYYNQEKDQIYVVFIPRELLNK